MEEDKVGIIKIKKVRHKGGGHGGSSWKVAYADFVTALMAFFLLMWLISMVSSEKQAKVSQYFREFNLFDKGGSVTGKTSVLKDKSAGGGGQIFKDNLNEEIERRLEDVKDQSVGAGGQVLKNKLKEEIERRFGDVKDQSARAGGQVFKNKLKEEIERRLGDVKDQVLVDVFGRNVRIELIDKDGSPMFPMASPKLNPKAREIIKVIYENFADTGAKIAIEGHTDAYNYATSQYTNWELSTERASSARRELELLGLSPDRIVRVSGLAATDPLIREDPHDPRNRRIRFLLFFEGEKARLMDLNQEDLLKGSIKNGPLPQEAPPKASSE